MRQYMHFLGALVPFVVLLNFASIAAGEDSTWVCIDPGHGGYLPGAIGCYKTGGLTDSVYEKETNLKVALFLRDSLYAIAAADPNIAFMAEMTRTTDVHVSFDQRAVLSNNQKGPNKPGDILISVHHNGVTDTTAKGTEVLWCSQANTTTGGKSRRNADSLASRVYAALQTHFAGEWPTIYGGDCENLTISRKFFPANLDI